MIDLALGVVCDQLNATLKSQFGTDEDLLRLSPVVGPDGGRLESDRLVMTLTNITHERTARSQQRQPRSSALPVEAQSLEIFFLVTASNERQSYAEALKLLSAVVAFFEQSSDFTPQNTPAMHASLQRLDIEPVNQTMQDLSALWQLHGGRYAPSVLFKMRCLGLKPGTPAVGHGRIQALTADET